MGCTSSKQARLDHRRSRSLLPPGLLDGTAGGTGSPRSSDEQMKKTANDPHAKPPRPRPVPVAAGTAITPPPNEPEMETINAWELMEGLEDITPLRPSLHHGSSASASFVTDFDPEIISTFRRALEDLSPRHPFFLRSPARQKSPDLTGIVRARVKLFQERIDARRSARANAAEDPDCVKCPPGGEGKVVLYFTSLHGVRETFEDCCEVRTMLKGCYGLRVDERDVSMHAGFKEELRKLVGVYCQLPQVFANGCCLGGAEELRQMHQAGELARAVEGCQMMMPAVAVSCQGCGDVRFVPCRRCSGSCKVFVEEEQQECCNGKINGGGFRRCEDCNENGIVRCPTC